MYRVWHVDKYKIIFRLIINWTNEILQHIVVSPCLSWPGTIDAKARYWAAARRLSNTAVKRSRPVYCFTYEQEKSVHPCQRLQTALYKCYCTDICVTD